MIARAKGRQIILNVDGTLTEDLMSLRGKPVTITFTAATVECVEANLAGDPTVDVVRVHVTATDVVLTDATPA